MAVLSHIPTPRATRPTPSADPRPPRDTCQAVAKVPDACFVLLNPDLDDTILSYTFGITISDRVRKFVRQFDTCYYYRGTFQMVRPSNARTHARAHAHAHTHACYPRF